jgi:hypothetical protein
MRHATFRSNINFALLAIFILAAPIILTGCLGEGTPSAEKQQKQQTAQAANEAQRQVGMPAIKNFQERKLAKMIFELRDQEDLVCYAYTQNDYTGKLVFQGKCIGFGLPYSVQYTNPEKIAYSGSAGRITLPQADPNQLYMPAGLSATWLMMLDPVTGDARPCYFEPEIVVSPFPLPNAEGNPRPPRKPDKPQVQ